MYIYMCVCVCVCMCACVHVCVCVTTDWKAAEGCFFHSNVGTFNKIYPVLNYRSEKFGRKSLPFGANKYMISYKLIGAILHTEK